MIIDLKISTLRPSQIRAQKPIACMGSQEMYTANEVMPTHSTWQFNFIWTSFDYSSDSFSLGHKHRGKLQIHLASKEDML